MATTYATPQANKENTGDARAAAPTIITPSSVENAGSSQSSLSKQRVIFSGRNLEHFFEPVLPANPTPLSTQEPSKSILKKRSYDEFLADDALFGSLVPQRSSTPEPETKDDLNVYLVSPVTTLVQSVHDSRAGEVNNTDIIEAYCVLTARIRAKVLLTPVVAAAGTNEPSVEKPEPVTGLHPAMEPVKEHIDHLVCAMTRDITRALEDPMKTAPVSTSMVETDPAATLPSPPSSSPVSVDSQSTVKRSGMNEQQVKHARDLCTVSQSAMKLLASLFCFTECVQSGELFTETHLSALLNALLAIPLSSPLPTPNSRKTSALSITLLTAFSTLLSSSESLFASAIAGIVSPNIQAITTSLRRGIDGELGREGKKGAAADSLRATIRFSIAQPDFFAAPFCTTLVPSLVKLLGTSSGVLQIQAGNALASIASAVSKAHLNPSELKLSTPDSNLDLEVGMLMRACFALRPAKGKGKNEIQLTPVLHNITKLFQALNAVCASRDAASTAGDGADGKPKEAPTPAVQAAAHMSAMWSLTVLSALIVLTDGCLFHTARKPGEKAGSKGQLVIGTGDSAAPASTAAKIIRILLDNKRTAIRTAASWAWRAFVWAVMREFERMDEEEDTTPNEDDSDEEKEEDEQDTGYTKHQKQRVQLVRRTFDFMDKGVGVGVICSLLVGSAGREDRELRLDLAIEALLVMARRKASASDAIQVLQRLLSTEGLDDQEDTEEGGPTLGWDINKFLPTPLLDGRLAEADSRSLLALAAEEKQAAKEADWVYEITPVTKSECKRRWSSFCEIWKIAVKHFGLHDNGTVMPSILELWAALLSRCSKPPSELILPFLEEPPHVWLNVANPDGAPRQITAHRVVQARFVNAHWCAMVHRFGPSHQMRKLAMEIYDQCLATFKFGETEGKVQDVCLELFYVLAEVESSVVVLIMEHEDLDADAKREFWTDAAKTPATAHKDELMRALSVAPFGEPRPFELTDADWESWEKLWQLYMDHDDSVGGRLMLQRLFAEQLTGNMLPQEACRIVASIVKSLPMPIKGSMDLTALFTMINQSLVMAYQSGSMDNMTVATKNLYTLTENFHQFTAEAFSSLSSGLVMWISDPDTLFSEADYDLIVGSTYDAVLRFLRKLPVNEETLADHSEILACITTRITAKAGTIKAFHSFWTEVYADVVSLDDVPDELRPLLLIREDESIMSQVEESSIPSPVDLPADSSFELPDLETSSSFELSPPPTPPSDTETLPPDDESHDPLSHAAPASECPEETDSDEESTMRTTKWTGSCEDLTQQVTGGRVAQSPYKASRPGGYLFSFQSPGSPIPGLGLYSSKPGTFHSSITANVARSPMAIIASSSSEDLSTPSSPYSRKRRAWDDEACTPVKRRKQERPDSDSDSDDDRTPIRPWFDSEGDQEKPDTSMVVPFQPFSKHNLPNGAYKFTGVSQATKEVAAANSVSGTTSSRRNPSIQAGNKGILPENAASFFVESAPLERNNPSAKRRRVIDPPTAQSPLSLQMAPYSDEVGPSSDDSPSDYIPASDDTVIAGIVSPSGIVSPAMAPAEAASDESTESPLKALVHRKKRLQESKLRSEVSASSMGASVSKSRTQVSSQAQLVDIQARQAMLTACQLMPSLDEVGLKRLSSYLEQMQAKVQDELRRKSESDQE